MPLLTQHKVSVKVTNTTTPIPVIDWDKFTGGDVTHSITRVRRSAGAAKEVLAGDYAGVSVGKPLQWFNCRVAKFTPPAADANGEEAAKLVIEWAVGS